MLFIIKNDPNPVLFTMTDLDEIDGVLYVIGSACDGVFTCRVNETEIEWKG